MFYPPITNKTKCCSFKNGCVVRAEMAKCVTSYSQRTLMEGSIIRLYNSKRHFSRPSLLTKQSALVLKVGVSYGWLSI